MWTGPLCDNIIETVCISISLPLTTGIEGNSKVQETDVNKEKREQHNKEENINKDNSSADKCLHMNAATEDDSPVNQFNDCALTADSLGMGLYIMVYRLYDFPCSFHPSILRVSVWGKERFLGGVAKVVF